jgi:hypothetical protein
MGYLIDLLVNIVADIIVWLVPGIVAYCYLRWRRSEFLRFFGLGRKRMITVYLSNLWLPSMKQRPWGCIVSGYEFKVTKTMHSLFGSAPVNLPELVQGLVNRFMLGAKIDLTIEVSPWDDGIQLAKNMIIVGATTKNSVRRQLVKNGMVYVTIADEPTEPPKADKEILTNQLQERFKVMRGKRTGEAVKRDGEYSLAVLERIRNEQDDTVVFMCTGRRGVGSWAATEYLARNWRELALEFADRSFARCLWFSPIDERKPEYQEPVHIYDVVPRLDKPRRSLLGYLKGSHR